MPVGDVTEFSKVDTAVWAALTTGGGTQTATLNLWRTEQAPSGSGDSGGRNFYLDELELANLRTGDFPFLAIDNGIATNQLTRGSGEEEYAYTISVIGGLGDTKENRVLVRNKLKKFATLARAALLDSSYGGCLGSLISGDNPILDIQITNLEFPVLVEPGDERRAWTFSFQAVFRIALQHRF